MSKLWGEQIWNWRKGDWSWTRFGIEATKKQELIEKYTVYLLLYMDTATLNGWRPKPCKQSQDHRLQRPPSKTEIQSTQLTLALRFLLKQDHLTSQAIGLDMICFPTTVHINQG